MEEYYDYDFPDDEKKVMGFKILENAMKWKQAAAAALKGMHVHTLFLVILVSLFLFLLLLTFLLTSYLCLCLFIDRFLNFITDIP